MVVSSNMVVKMILQRVVPQWDAVYAYHKEHVHVRIVDRVAAVVKVGLGDVSLLDCRMD